MQTKAIKFNQEYEVQDEHRGTSKATVYKKDEVREFSPGAADHFVRRGVASPLEPGEGGKSQGGAAFSGTKTFKANGETELSEGVTVANVDLIAAAAEAAKLDVEGWNKLKAEDREAAILAEIERRKAPAE